MSFSGNNDDITVDEFIYRVNRYTDLHLGGRFYDLIRYIHILFRDRALQWLWRNEKEHEAEMDWFSLCQDLKAQYKTPESEFDMQLQVIHRKQKPNETFDDFYAAITRMCDRLAKPFKDNDLKNILLKNLRPDIRKELLHVRIYSIADLRREVRRHENFTKEQSRFASSSARQQPQKHVSEIFNEEEEISGHICEDSSEENEVSVCAFSVKDKEKWICHNCSQKGHGHRECDKPKKIRCYSCGTPGEYRPTCKNANCPAKQENRKSDVRQEAEHPAPEKPRSPK